MSLNILVIRSGTIGDMAVALPAIRALSIEHDLTVFQLGKESRGINFFIPYLRKFASVTTGGRLDLIRKLHKGKFDAVVDLYQDRQSFLSKLSSVFIQILFSNVALWGGLIQNFATPVNKVRGEKQRLFKLIEFLTAQTFMSSRDLVGKELLRLPKSPGFGGAATLMIMCGKKDVCRLTSSQMQKLLRQVRSNSSSLAILIDPDQMPLLDINGDETTIWVSPLTLIEVLSILCDSKKVLSVDTGFAHLAELVGIEMRVYVGHADRFNRWWRDDDRVSVFYPSRLPSCSPCFSAVCKMDQKCIADLEMQADV